MIFLLSKELTQASEVTPGIEGGSESTLVHRGPGSPGAESRGVQPGSSCAKSCGVRPGSLGAESHVQAPRSPGEGPHSAPGSLSDMGPHSPPAQSDDTASRTDLSQGTRQLLLSSRLRNRRVINATG